MRLDGEVLGYGWKQHVSAGQGVTDGKVKVSGVASLPFHPHEAATFIEGVNELPTLHEDAYLRDFFGVAPGVDARGWREVQSRRTQPLRETQVR